VDSGCGCVDTHGREGDGDLGGDRATMGYAVKPSIPKRGEEMAFLHLEEKEVHCWEEAGTELGVRPSTKCRSKVEHKPLVASPTSPVLSYKRSTSSSPLRGCSLRSARTTEHPSFPPNLDQRLSKTTFGSIGSKDPRGGVCERQRRSATASNEGRYATPRNP
jgi:hypothetical protein